MFLEDFFLLGNKSSMCGIGSESYGLVVQSIGIAWRIPERIGWSWRRRDTGIVFLLHSICSNMNFITLLQVIVFVAKLLDSSLNTFYQCI